MSDAQIPVPPSPYGAPAQAPERSPLAVASLWVGVAAVVLDVISQFALFATIYSRGGTGDVQVVQLVFGVLVLLLAFAAGVIGLVALAARPGNRQLAGIGVGIALALVVMKLVGFVAAPIASLFA